MNDNAKHAITSLIESREKIKELAKPEDVEAIWEGWLTIVSAVYGGQDYPDVKYFIESEGTRE